MNQLLEDKNEISGRDFAIEITELAFSFMSHLESVHDKYLKNDIAFANNSIKHIDDFNKEILKIVAKLPPKILGALLHDSVIKKTLDPGCSIEINRDKIHVYLSKNGTIQ